MPPIIHFILKWILSNICKLPQLLLLSICKAYIFPLFTLKLSMYLHIRCVSYQKAYKMNLCYLNANFSLLTGKFNLHTFLWLFEIVFLSCFEFLSCSIFALYPLLIFLIDYNVFFFFTFYQSTSLISIHYF